MTDKLAVPFIVGVGRSGTTLLRLMLDANPLLAIPPETHFFGDLIQSPPDNAQTFIDILANHQTWASFDLMREALAEELERIGDFDLSEAIRCFYRQYARKFDKPLWGDKTPPYVLAMPQIQQLLPEVKFIHLIRDGRDVALSYQSKWFGPEDKSISSLANFWKKRILHARNESQHLLPESYLEVQYEHLIRAPAVVLQDICDYLSIPFSAAMLDYHQQAPERLAELQDWRNRDGSVDVSQQQHLSIHQHVKAPPDSAQIGKWQSRWSAAEIDEFEATGADLLRSLGYL